MGDEPEAALVVLLARIMWADGWRLSSTDAIGRPLISQHQGDDMRGIREGMLRALERFVTVAFVKLARSEAAAEKVRVPTRAEEEQAILDAPPIAMRPGELEALSRPFDGVSRAAPRLSAFEVTPEDEARVKAFVEGLFAASPPSEPPTRDDLPSLWKGEETIPPPKDGAA